MTQVIASLLLLGCLSCPPAAAVSVSGPVPLNYLSESASPVTGVPQSASLTLHDLGLWLQSAVVSAPLSYILAQMSRDEHERLRLELRQRTNPDGTIGPLNTLITPPFLRSGLTLRERQRLREQLRQQRQALETADGLAPDPVVGTESGLRNAGTTEALVPAGRGSAESASAAPAIVDPDGVPAIIKPKQ